MKNIIVKLSLLLVISFVLYIPAFAKENKITIAIEDFPDVVIPTIKSGSLVFGIGGQVFAGLTRYNTNGEIIPYLAKSWVVSEDFLIYTFKLHDNAYFHDGEEINADDIVFSLEMSKKNHPFYPFLEAFDRASIIDDKTVRVFLSKPLPIFVSLLHPLFVPILPKHIYETEDGLTLKLPTPSVIGSGPFFIKEYKDGEFIHLEKNPRFFLADYPRLDSIEYKVFLSEQEMAYALSLGDVDMATFSSSTKVNHFMQDTQGNEFNVLPYHNLYPYFMVVYNLEKNPLSNPKVRQAFTLGINRERLTKLLSSSDIKPMWTPISPLSPFALAYEQEVDVQKANILLDEAGYPRDESGKRFSLTIDYLDYPFHRTLIRWLQSEFSTALGIEIKTRDYTDFVNVEKNVASGNFDLFLDEPFSWNDPLIGLHRLYFSKNMNKNTIWTNNSKYQNKELDEFFAKAMAERDSQKRFDIYKNVQNILIEDTASLWLMSNDYATITSQKIKHLGSLYYTIMSPFLEVEKIEEIER